MFKNYIEDSKPLEAGQLQDLVIQFKSTPSDSLAEKIISGMAKLIVSNIAHFNTPTMADVVTAQLAILTCLRNFDIDKGFLFITYASSAIKRQVYRNRKLDFHYYSGKSENSVKYDVLSLNYSYNDDEESTLLNCLSSKEEETAGKELIKELISYVKENKNLSERDKSLLVDYLEFQPRKDLAVKYDVTKQRVEQIINKFKSDARSNFERFF